MVAKRKQSLKSDVSVLKTKPTIFPLGFSVSLVDDGSVLVDFVDVLNGVPTIIESIALSNEKAMALSSALIKIVENEESED